jgi:ASC-1-like (ASCH) protein
MDKTIKYRVNLKALSLIDSSKKVVEGRLCKNSFLKLKKGDKLIFYNESKYTIVLIEKIQKYDTFKNMLINEGIKRVTPLSNSLEESISIYRNFYSIEDELKYGVLAITLKKIKQK